MLDDDDDSEKTPLLCHACGGRYTRSSSREGDVTYKEFSCRFCTQGFMTSEQYRFWSDWRIKALEKEREKQEGKK